MIAKGDARDIQEDAVVGNRQSGIFATPTEPIFTLKPDGMHADLLESWLRTLVEENMHKVASTTYKQGYFKKGKSADMAIMLCEKLGLGAEAKYLTLELFDRFMTAHLRDLHNHVKQNSRSSSKKNDWAAIQERVRAQITLRMMSCCQVASKLTSHYKIIGLKKAWSVLNEFGHRYSYDSLVQSEMRILMTLNFEVMPHTPLLYVETLLEILGNNEPSAEVKVYHTVCLKVIDICYSRRTEIYSQLFQLATGQVPSSKSSTPERQKFAAVEVDLMLQSVAIIAASSYIVDSVNTDKIISGLSDITHIPTEDILDFTTVVIQNLNEKNHN